jgi:hypothetical protein
MTQYARPNADTSNPQHNPFGGVDGWLREDTSTWEDIYVSIDEPAGTSGEDDDYIQQQNSGATTSTYKAALGNTATDPVTALSNHKVKFRAVSNDSSMAGVPTLTVSLYDTTADTPLIVTDDFSQAEGLEDEGMMGGGTWADFTISLDSTQAGNIVSYDDLEIWFRMSSSNGMGDYVKVSQAWFECADVPEEEAATTSPAFLLFVE